MTRPLFSSIPDKEAKSTFAGSLTGGPKSAAVAGDKYVLGNRYEGLAGIEGLESDMIPVVEFEHVTPVAVQFYADPSVVLAAPGADGNSWNYTFSGGGTPPNPMGPFGSQGFIFFDVGGVTTNDDAPHLLLCLQDKTPHNVMQLLAFTSTHPTGSGTVYWTVSGDGNEYEFDYTAVEMVTLPAGAGTGTFLRLTLANRSQSMSSALLSGNSAIVSLSAPKPAPNVVPIARVSFAAGTSGNVTFDADWAGGFVLHAKKLSVARVNRALDPRISYVDGSVRLAVTVCPAAPHSPHAASLTVLPLVILPTETRLITIPPLARRVSLLCLYQLGDAPLALMHIAFTTLGGTSLHWIDALSARAALFGDGINVPPGSATLALTNRSEDPDLALGAVFHLAF